MRSRILYRPALAAVCLMAGLSACTSVDVDPCSRPAIEARIDQVVNVYARENRRDISDIKRAAQYLRGDTANGAMQLVFAVSALERLVDNFQADVVPEVQSISQQCGTTENVRELFFDFLKDEGVNREVLKWAENLAPALEAVSESR